MKNKVRNRIWRGSFDFLHDDVAVAVAGGWLYLPFFDTNFILIYIPLVFLLYS